MAGDRYFITDQYATYFLTCTVVYWVDVFTRKEYRDIIVSSLNHCIQNKGLEVNAWVIMSNHIHLVCRADEKNAFQMCFVILKNILPNRSWNAYKQFPKVEETGY